MQQSTNVSITDGVTRQAHVIADDSNPNRPMFVLDLLDEDGVTVLGAPFRVWLQDGRFMGDLPGVNETYFNIEAGDDHIALNE